jgi:hypothetical protein
MLNLHVSRQAEPCLGIVLFANCAVPIPLRASTPSNRPAGGAPAAGASWA